MPPTLEEVKCGKRLFENLDFHRMTMQRETQCVLFTVISECNRFPITSLKGTQDKQWFPSEIGNKRALHVCQHYLQITYVTGNMYLQSDFLFALYVSQKFLRKLKWQFQTKNEDMKTSSILFCHKWKASKRENGEKKNKRKLSITYLCFASFSEARTDIKEVFSVNIIPHYLPHWNSHLLFASFFVDVSHPVFSPFCPFHLLPLCIFHLRFIPSYSVRSLTHT